MDNANNQVFITSVNKAVNRAKLTGHFDVILPRLYQIFAENLQWLKHRRDEGVTGYDNDILHLQNKLVDMRRKYSQEICNYKTVIKLCGNVPNIYPGGTTTSEYQTNNAAPAVDGVTIPLATSSTYIFSQQDFTTNYTDANGNTPHKVIIYFSSLTGSLKFDNQPISGIFEFELKDAHKLVYTRAADESFNTTFNFRVSDYTKESRYSNMATNTLTGDSLAISSTVIGDNTVIALPNTTTVLTFAMFTTDTVAPYSDTEGDLLDAIRIDRIHATNVGKFYLSGIEISVGLIITREQMIAELFTHTSTNPEDIASDGFEFSGRDEGSMIWVQ